MPVAAYVPPKSVVAIALADLISPPPCLLENPESTSLSSPASYPTRSANPAVTCYIRRALTAPFDEIGARVKE